MSLAAGLDDSFQEAFVRLLLCLQGILCHIWKATIPLKRKDFVEIKENVVKSHSQCLLELGWKQHCLSVKNCCVLSVKSVVIGILSAVMTPELHRLQGVLSFLPPEKSFPCVALGSYCRGDGWREIGTNTVKVDNNSQKLIFRTLYAMILLFAMVNKVLKTASCVIELGGTFLRWNISVWSSCSG